MGDCVVGLTPDKSLILAQYVATTKPIIIDVMFPKSVRDSKLKIKKKTEIFRFFTKFLNGFDIPE